LYTLPLGFRRIDRGVPAYLPPRDHSGCNDCRLRRWSAIGWRRSSSLVLSNARRDEKEQQTGTKNLAHECKLAQDWLRNILGLWPSILQYDWVDRRLSHCSVACFRCPRSRGAKKAIASSTSWRGSGYRRSCLHSCVRPASARRLNILGRSRTGGVRRWRRNWQPRKGRSTTSIWKALTVLANCRASVGNLSARSMPIVRRILSRRRR